jgi:hypothetical protein
MADRHSRQLGDPETTIVEQMMMKSVHGGQFPHPAGRDRGTKTRHSTTSTSKHGLPTIFAGRGGFPKSFVARTNLVSAIRSIIRLSQTRPITIGNLCARSIGGDYETHEHEQGRHDEMGQHGQAGRLGHVQLGDD